jgi:hypothetical protein
VYLAQVRQAVREVERRWSRCTAAPARSDDARTAAATSSARYRATEAR